MFKLFFLLFASPNHRKSEAICSYCFNFVWLVAIDSTWHQIKRNEGQSNQFVIEKLINLKAAKERFSRRFHQYCAGFSTPFKWSVFKFVLSVRTSMWVSHAVCRHKINCLLFIVVIFLLMGSIVCTDIKRPHTLACSSTFVVGSGQLCWPIIFECHHRLCATVTMNSII